MPESPEVQALVDALDERAGGLTVESVDVLEFRAVKTREAPPSTLVGHRIGDARRHGKHVELLMDDASLVLSLGRHGWVRWRAAGAPADAPPALASLTFDDGDVMDVTDAGTWVSLGLHVVGDAREVPAIAKLGPDPADTAYSRADFDAAFGARRKQAKAVLQEQESIAGIGNAYSDEILHLSRVAPVVHAAALDDAQRDRLFDATLSTVREAIEARRGIPIDRLKTAKVASMRIHGRTGAACPVCGDTIRDLAFSGTTAQYCPTCQNGGVAL